MPVLDLFEESRYSYRSADSLDAWEDWSAHPADRQPLQSSLTRRILTAGAAPFRWLLRK